MKQGTRKSKIKIKAARKKLEAFKASAAYSQFLTEIGKIKAELEALEGVKNEKNKN